MLSAFFRRFAGRGPEIRMASIYRRQARDYVTASSRTRDGFWLEEGRVDVLDSANAALTEAVRAALARSRDGIAAPKDWSSHVNRVVEVAGLKRFSAFAKGTALVSVQEASGQLRLIPHRNEGSREGYVGLEDEALQVDLDSPDIAKAIELAFKRCT
jgi:hypothetical protein